MRNLAVGLLILAAGGWFLVEGRMPRIGAAGSGGAIGGYSSSPAPALGAAQSAAGGILK